jgi:hypothetical protein
MISQNRIECEFLFPSGATVMDIAKDLGSPDRKRTAEEAEADRLLTASSGKAPSACLHLDLPAIDSPEEPPVDMGEDEGLPTVASTFPPRMGRGAAVGVSRNIFIVRRLSKDKRGPACRATPTRQMRGTVHPQHQLGVGFPWSRDLDLQTHSDVANSHRPSIFGGVAAI